MKTNKFKVNEEVWALGKLLIKGKIQKICNDKDLGDYGVYIDNIFYATLTQVFKYPNDLDYLIKAINDDISYLNETKDSLFSLRELLKEGRK